MGEAPTAELGRASALTFAGMAGLAGLLVGWWIGNRILGASEETLHLVVGGMSVFTLAAAFAKDGLLALIDLVASLWSGVSIQTERMGSAIAMLFVVSLLATTSTVLFAGNRPSTPTTCKGIAPWIEGGRKVDGDTAALISKCISDDLDSLAEKVDGLITATTKFDQKIAQINAKVAPCPLLFDNAGLVEDGTGLSGHGVCLGPGQLGRIEDMADYLADHCRGSLILHVTGYASEAPFRNVSKSGELNRQTANLRAASVAEALGRELESRNVDAVFQVKIWRAGEDEEMARPRFADEGALEQRDQWLIDRSVFVRVENPSSCGVHGD